MAQAARKSLPPKEQGNLYIRFTPDEERNWAVWEYIVEQARVHRRSNVAQGLAMLEYAAAHMEKL